MSLNNLLIANIQDTKEWMLYFLIFLLNLITIIAGTVKETGKIRKLKNNTWKTYREYNKMKFTDHKYQGSPLDRTL